MKVKRNILLNPGPATTSDTVKFAQIMPDICPREKEFADVVSFISSELPKFLKNGEDFETVLFGGSGTAAMESMISSAANGKGVIVNNGAYGKRFCEIASSYDIDYIEFSSPVDRAIDMESLEETIKKIGDAKFLVLVHHETTTGLLNDLKVAGQLAKKHKLVFIVDAISSYAGLCIDVKECNISFLASTSNKNLQGMAGVAFVLAKKDELEKLKDAPKRGYYLNLYENYMFFKKNYQMRFTPPVQVMYAMKQAILELKEETLAGRHQRYSECWSVMIKGMKSAGFKCLVDESIQSKLLTTFLEPDFIPNYSFEEMHDYLYAKGFTIYPGKVGVIGTFRIANIGQLYPTDMIDFQGVMDQFIKYKLLNKN